jgi:hypothetical protein
MRSLVIAVLTLVGLPVMAADILSPEDFETYADGKTLYFSQQGQPYGVEQYLPNRKAIWQYSDGTCTRGIWYAEGSQICFVYEGDGLPQCWHFLKKSDGFSARAVGREPGSDLDVIWRDERPISCKGPDIGV